jgi:acyl carrier protein
MVVIWQEVLRTERIGVNDNFFRVGGNSLKAITLASKIHKTLNIEIPLKEIFSRKTIHEIAKYIENAEKNIYLSIQPAGEKEHYPVSPAQRRLYILSQLENIHTSYNMPGVMLMCGNVDKAKVEEVFKLLIKRHEVLRTSFEFVGGTPIQYTHNDVDFRIDYMELSENLDLGGEGVLGSTVEKMLKDFIRPFDLSRAPLLRAGLVRLAEAEYVLMYDIHHIISDGVSIEILMNEFACLYEGKPLNELRLQYKDFAEWQNNNLSNKAIRKQEEYWLEKFSGKIPVLNMPTDFPRPGVRSFEGDHVRFEISRDLADGLYSLVGETDSTLYMALLAVYNVLLSKYTGQEDILVGLSTSGRNHADLEGIIGMFVNTLVMRNYPEGEKTFICFFSSFINSISLKRTSGFFTTSLTMFTNRSAIFAMVSLANNFVQYSRITVIPSFVSTALTLMSNFAILLSNS